MLRILYIIFSIYVNIVYIGRLLYILNGLDLFRTARPPVLSQERGDSVKMGWFELKASGLKLRDSGIGSRLIRGDPICT